MRRTSLGSLHAVTLGFALLWAGFRSPPSSEVDEDLGDAMSDGNKSDGSGAGPRAFPSDASPPSTASKAMTEPASSAAIREGVCAAAADMQEGGSSADASDAVGVNGGVAMLWISKSHPATSLMYRSMDLTSRAWFSGVDVAALMLPETMWETRSGSTGRPSNQGLRDSMGVIRRQRIELLVVAFDIPYNVVTCVI